MTGLERDAEVVHLTSYAPLFAHVDGWQWTPDLIWFDNLRVYGTPNYYVQKLFANHRGSHVFPILLNGQSITGQDGLYASAVINKSTKEVIVKIVNNSESARNKSVQINGLKGIMPNAKKIVLKVDDLKAENLSITLEIFIWPKASLSRKETLFQPTLTLLA